MTFMPNAVWLRDLPNIGFLPQFAHFAIIISSFKFCEHGSPRYYRDEQATIYDLSCDFLTSSHIRFKSLLLTSGVVIVMEKMP